MKAECCKGGTKCYFTVSVISYSLAGDTKASNTVTPISWSMGQIISHGGTT